MPWKETEKIDQRIEFALRSLRCSNFGELCRQFGVSRKTGYKWRERFLAEGIAGMGERSRRPHTHPAGLPEPVVCEIVRLKHAHPTWGPRKIRELYRRSQPAALPSESTFKRVLERAGLTTPRRRRRARDAGRLSTGRVAKAPNDVWTVDFKGWWRARDGSRVEPLTVRDEHSRMVLELRALADARTETVRACFERLFEAHGLPAAIRSDNGPPFASSAGLLGLTRLAAWWLALGIDLERAFELWRHEFNNVRPHESLGMACPAELYTPSPRPYTGTPDSLDYGAMDTRRVQRAGFIYFRSRHVPICAALAGWDVGPGDTSGGLTELWFAHLPIGHLEPDTLAFHPAATGQPAGSATLHRPPGRDPKTKANNQNRNPT